MWQEILDFLSFLWEAKTVLIIAIIATILFLFWGKIVVVIRDTKETFGKGGKKND